MTAALWSLENLLKWQLWVASEGQWMILWICIWRCKYPRTRRTCDSYPEGRLAKRKRGECFAPLLVSAGAAELIGFPWGALPNRESPWTATLKNDSFALQLSCLLSTQRNDYSPVNLRKPTKMTIVSCLKSAMKDSLNSHLKMQIHTNS